MASTTRVRNKLETRTRTVSANEAKQHWGAMMRAVSEGEDVIVESHGKPKAVVISTDAHQQLQQARAQARREEAMRLLREIETRYDGRNDDLTEAEIEQLAVRAGREINHAVAERLRDRARRSE